MHEIVATSNMPMLLAFSFIGLFAIFFFAFWLVFVQAPKAVRWLMGYR